MGDVAEQLAHDAVEWLLAQAREDGTSLSWRPCADKEVDPTLYNGCAGIVLALIEAHHHFGDDRYGDAALRGAHAVAAAVDDEDLWSSLYPGRAGMAVALHAAGTRFGDETCLRAARHALDRVRAAFDGERWNDFFELLGGNAGIALGALLAGDLDLAELAVEPYLRTADATPGGVNWAVRPSPPRSHHMAHGTLGIVLALATVARATGRQDLLDLALAGAADVVARNEEGPDGFLVPHSDPQHRPELVERYSYGWCNGPAGDTQTFRLLAAITGDAQWDTLIDQCWHTLTHSGLPARLRPGFWDNNGVCCGTAGVLMTACDRFVEHPTEGRAAHDFATLLVDDLAERATVDATGARWSNHEHRKTPGDLPPRTGWAMGNAGILRELIRYTRVTRGLPGYAVQWPGHPAVRRSGSRSLVA
ncbi:lanthionine synthetase LanC family protein [Labedaea rhizosphaerae]|uniref:Lanthionine synthetase-like protein n=1 Tax=Labedaea rhizosphaerae TaxID=598644 RepID=A0A4R6S6T5_LABRH|nr:lanthionine synthetase LanC family protein [Labedaea rhizosphaerae]TDP94907.1 lanthionine synthetase-like protein [Labedaea rhizosphaerae]